MVLKLLFLVLKLLWAIRGKKSRKASSRWEQLLQMRSANTADWRLTRKLQPMHTAVPTLTVSSLGVPALLSETARHPSPQYLGSVLTL